MATYVKGNAVANATSYELYEKSGTNYTLLDSASEINFEVSALGLAAGDHVLVVKAKASGYSDSDYSNTVTYTAENSGSEVDLTDSATAIAGATNATGGIATSSYFQTMSVDVSAYRGRTLEFMFIKYTSGSGTQSSNYCGFVDSNGTFTPSIQAPISSLGSTKGESYVATVNIPSDASVFKTTWFVQNAVDKGVYSGSVSDFYAKVTAA